MDKHTVNYIRKVLSGPNAREYQKDTRQRYQYKNRPRVRELQFLRPKLYCYAFPEHFSSMPASQPMQENVFARITNAGGGASYNTVVKLLATEHNNITTTSKQTLTLQPGETRELTFGMSSIERVRRYQIVCFDPLHDPVPSWLPPAADPKSALTNAVDPTYDLSAWQEYQYDSDGNLVPVPVINSWQTQSSDPPPARIKLEPDQSYFACAGPKYSELRQAVVLADLDFSGHTTHFQGFLSAGDLLASLDAYVRLGDAPRPARAQIGLDFLAANGARLESFRTPSPTTPNVWQRHTAAVAFPPETAKIVVRLICERPFANLSGHAYFDELNLALTHRSVFTSSRIYTFY